MECLKDSMDLVTVVIPTYDRPVEDLKQLLVDRCLKSVYKQTYTNIEIIVIVDNVSENAINILESEKHMYPNLNFYEYGEKVGAATTRNFGISKAKGKWIALLDDDDEWFEDKIENQLEFIKKNEDTIVFSSLKSNNKVLPRIAYNDNIAISEYLMCRKLGKRYGIIQSSSIFCSKKVFQNIPFTDRLQKHQDWDWIIRASMVYKIQHQNIALSIYHVDAKGRMSENNSWKYSKWWIGSIKDIITPEAYSSFLLEMVLKGVMRDNTITRKEKKAYFLEILRETSMKSYFRISNYYVFLISLLR